MTQPHAPHVRPFHVPPGIRPYLRTLAGNQVKVLIHLSDLSGSKHEWVSIGLSTISADLGLRRKTVIDALRAIVACGLVERTSPGCGARHWYRTNPTIPAQTEGQITGRASGPSLVRKSHQLPDSVVQFPNQSTGSKTAPSPIHMEMFFAGHPYITITTKFEGISSSSAVVPEKAEEDKAPPAGAIKKAPPAYRDFRTCYPKPRLDDAKARAAFDALPPLEKKFCFQGLLAHLTCERWVRSMANGCQFIPLASNFIRRREYAADPPPHLDHKLNASETRQQKKSEELAARARAIFERSQE